MRQVIFTYDNNSSTRHNAEGISTATIAKLVGDTTGYTETTYDSKAKIMRSKEVNLRVIKAAIF